MLISIVNKTVLTTAQRDELRWEYGVNDFYDDDVISAEQLLERIGSATVVVTNVGAEFTADILKQHPQIQVIISASTGVDHIDIGACEARGVKVRSFPDYCAQALAEKALTFALMGLNRIPQASHNVNAGRWDYDAYQGLDLSEAIIGVIGAGHSGGALARLAEALGMAVLTVNSRSSEEQFDDLLRTSDVISLHVPATPQTRHMLNGSRLAKMKKSVSLINVSRGALIDEDALAAFLRGNPQGTAFLDVLSCEPPGGRCSLLGLPNVVLTPHIAWNSKLSERRLQASLFQTILEEAEMAKSRRHNATLIG